MATNMYGTYDPYSADNLSGYGNATPEASGLMSQLPVDQLFLPQNEGDGEARMTMSQSKGPTLFGGAHELNRATAPLVGVGQNALKNAIMGGNPLSAIKGSPLAVAKGMTDAGGFAPQDTQSKMVSMLAKGGLGLMGGPASMVLSPLVDVGVSFGMDGLDARDYEAVRDEVEDSGLGEAGGRRVYADFSDALKASGIDQTSREDANSVADMLSNYASQVANAKDFSHIDTLQRAIEAQNATQTLQDSMAQGSWYDDAVASAKQKLADYRDRSMVGIVGQEGADYFANRASKDSANSYNSGGNGGGRSGATGSSAGSTSSAGGSRGLGGR